ncbi:hypothetical protein KAU43_00665 [candidate division WOR-3 bacterium]|nr:hypothetical protein [candidate division WOR-3 bacterium]
MENRETIIKNSIEYIAELMASSAITAPKTKGMDDIDVKIIYHSEFEKIAKKMEEIGKRDDLQFFIRDADNLRNSDALVLIAIKSVRAGIRNCNLCDYDDCSDNLKHNSICTFNIIDSGIAIGSAVSIASKFNVDNRIMYSVARAVNELNIFESNIKCIVGIPLSIKNKNIFFDRK